MTVDDGDVPAQKENDAVHPPGAQPVQVSRPGSACLMAVVAKRAMCSTGTAAMYQSAVRSSCDPSGPVTRNPGDRRPEHWNVQARAETELDAQVAEMVQPRIDPDVAGRSVEQPVRRPPRDPDIEEQLKKYVAPRAGADLRASGDQCAGEAVSEEPLVAGRALGRPGEPPPALLLPLAVAAGFAAGQEYEEPLEEMGYVAGGESRLAPRDVADHLGQVGRRVGEPDRDQQRDFPPVLAISASVACRRLSRTPRLGPRGSAHRVGQVAVEAGEETEPVFGR